MKVYIQTDIEGVTGWISFEDRKTQTQENLDHRYRMYRLLTQEVNAAVRAAHAAGAKTVVVNDSHGSGYNLFFEDLEPDCAHAEGGCPRKDNYGGVREGRAPVSVEPFRGEDY